MRMVERRMICLCQFASGTSILRFVLSMIATDTNTRLSQRQPFVRARVWMFVFLSLVYGVGILIVSGLVPQWKYWYSPSPHHRTQSQALLRGKLALSSHPSDLALNLSWSEEGVQQVWGLGIPLWRMPFEILAKVAGHSSFPDRIVLGLSLGIVAFIGLQKAIHPVLGSSKDSPPQIFAVCIGALVELSLLLAFPPFLSLLQARGEVFEEVLIYAYLYGLFLAYSVMAVEGQANWLQLVWLGVFAGLGGLIRPTLMFYGLATIITATLVHRRGKVAETSQFFAAKRGSCLAFVGHRSFHFGILAFVAGGSILWWTNLIRFGDGFEFGHKLNLQDGTLLGSVYATRFDHPFQEETLWRAARELLGALFLDSEFNGARWYAELIFPGQSPALRLREFYFTTFDLSYAVLVSMGWVVGGWMLLKWRRRPRCVVHSSLRTAVLEQTSHCDSGGQLNQAVACEAQNRPPMLGVLALWSLLACVPLAIFYLRSPAISSRYMMDFAPGFAVAIVVLWRWAIETINAYRPKAMRHQLFLWVMFLAWFGWELSHAKSAYGPPRSIAWDEVFRPSEKRNIERHVSPLPSTYTAGEDLANWGIPYNGAGWEVNGSAGVCLILFVESPEFLELEFAPAAKAETSRTDAEQIRAKVGLEHLQREEIERTARGWRVRFARPANKRYQHGIQPVFIATVPREDLADRTTPWVLERVSWRVQTERILRGRE
jgi:hypothetical protein